MKPADDRLRLKNWEIKQMTLGILLVVAAILVVVGILVVTYKLVSRLPRDGGNGNGEGDAG